MEGANSFAEGYAIGRDSNNGYNNGMFGDGAWWIIILLLAGWGNGGWGNGNFGGSAGGFINGYDLGKVATTNDVANGFSTSAIMSDLNDILLGQAGIQQTLCQGFNGVNTSILTSTNQVNQGICNLGFNLQNGLNGISREISDCCCKTQRAIDGVNYNMATNTCNITSAINNSTRDIIDSQRDGTNAILNFLTNEKISSLQAENAALTAQLSQNSQTQTLINTLRPCPQPAYITCSPYESVYGLTRNNGGCCGGNF